MSRPNRDNSNFSYIDSGDDHDPQRPFYRANELYNDEPVIVTPFKKAINLRILRIRFFQVHVKRKNALALIKTDSRLTIWTKYV